MQGLIDTSCQGVTAYLLERNMLTEFKRVEILAGRIMKDSTLGREHNQQMERTTVLTYVWKGSLVNSNFGDINAV